jgi:hypothetical protein
MKRGMNRDIPPILQEANVMFDKGEYFQAAKLFEQLAITAEGRDGPRAPMLLLQTGRAYMLAGKAAIGVDFLQRGLSLLGQRGQLPRLEQAGNRVVNDLSSRGFKVEAAQVAELLRTFLPGFQPAPVTNVDSKKRPILPTHCPSCGAGVKPDEVEWLDDLTAECDYCGSPIRAE